MEHSFLYSPEEVLQHFGVSENTGLSQEQVLASRQKYGSNGKLCLPGIIRVSFCCALLWALADRSASFVQQLRRSLLHRSGSLFWNNSKTSSS